jgi:hypothetical protein
MVGFRGKPIEIVHTVDCIYPYYIASSAQAFEGGQHSQLQYSCNDHGAARNITLPIEQIIPMGFADKFMKIKSIKEGET